MFLAISRGSQSQSRSGCRCGGRLTVADTNYLMVGNGVAKNKFREAKNMKFIKFYFFRLKTKMKIFFWFNFLIVIIFAFSS